MIWVHFSIVFLNANFDIFSIGVLNKSYSFVNKFILGGFCNSFLYYRGKKQNCSTSVLDPRYEQFLLRRVRLIRKWSICQNEAVTLKRLSVGLTYWANGQIHELNVEYRPRAKGLRSNDRKKQRQTDRAEEWERNIKWCTRASQKQLNVVSMVSCVRSTRS